MAKVSFIYDTRRGDDVFPLVLRISHRQQCAHISTGIKIRPDQWDGEKIVNHPAEKSLNDFLITKRTMVESALMKFGLTNNLNKFTATQLKVVAESGGETAEKSMGHSFVKFFQKCIEKKEKRKTILSYETSLKKLREADPLLDTRTFEDIDEVYIENIDSTWKSAGLSTNSRAVYFRNIRSVVNDAIDERLTTTYAFRKFSIKKEPTKKRNLSIEELRLLKDYPIVNEFQKKYRDIFMLMFYMRGINAVDIFALKKSNIRAGRINYIRSKTGKAYSVKIEPEMQEIFNRYKGKDYLLDVCDGATNRREYEVKYEGFLQRMDRGLKKIGPYTRSGLGGKKTIAPILPDLSQYWCRHTTATLMSDMGVSNDFIACSLGHESGNKTTNIYIEYNEKKVDEANRALIDYVNEK